MGQSKEATGMEIDVDEDMEKLKSTEEDESLTTEKFLQRECDRLVAQCKEKGSIKSRELLDYFNLEYTKLRTEMQAKFGQNNEILVKPNENSDPIATMDQSPMTIEEKSTEEQKISNIPDSQIKIKHFDVEIKIVDDNLVQVKGTETNWFRCRRNRKKEFFFGRSTGKNFRKPYGFSIRDDPEISTTHAQLKWTSDNSVVFIDLESTNGSKVLRHDGNIRLNPMEPFKLSIGEDSYTVIQIGSTNICFTVLPNYE